MSGEYPSGCENIIQKPRIGTKLISPRTNRTYKVVSKEITTNGQTLYFLDQVDGLDSFQMIGAYLILNYKKVWTNESTTRPVALRRWFRQAHAP